ncbi:MAG: hypothetical protein OK436_06840 [Thaumarchaeota archaeon]|nr:hypothetical protein [Nitrososphaerota archaeon]
MVIESGSVILTPSGATLIRKFVIDNAAKIRSGEKPWSDLLPILEAIESGGFSI